MMEKPSLLPENRVLVSLKVNAILLAAGEGTRFEEITKITPKPLVSIFEDGEISLLSSLLSTLLKIRISTIYVVLGHLKTKLMAFFDENFTEEQQEGRIRLVDSGKQYLKGPLYSFLSVCSHIPQTIEHPFLILPADTYFQEALILKICNFVLNHYESAMQNPFLFYRKGNPSDLKEKLTSGSDIEAKRISIAQMQEDPNTKQRILAHIEKQSSSFSKIVAQIIPVFSFPKETFRVIQSYEKEAEVKTLGSMINYLISETELKVYCHQIYRFNTFFDIDNLYDLNSLRQYLEKEGDNSNSQK